MDLTLPYRPNLVLPCSRPASTAFLRINSRRRPRISRQKSSFRVRCSADGNGSDGFSWANLVRSVRLGSERFFSKLGESVKKETGLDMDETNAKVSEYVERVKDGVKKGESVLNRCRTELVPEFIDWNRWERWKDFNNWEPKRVGALVLYALAVIVSCQKLYGAIRAPSINRQKKELTEAYMEALIPEPSPTNIRQFKKSMWRKTMPKGLKLKKFIEGPNGTLVHDSSYVGEDAWEDNLQPRQENIQQVIDNNVKLNAEEKWKLKEDLGISGGEGQKTSGTWRERIQKWKEILRGEKFSEELDSQSAKYVVEFDMKEVEESLRKDVVGKVTETEGTRALWIAKRWWLYRPKLPYTYFLDKLDSSEVDAVVFTEDLKRLYVTMKEGFPLEYVVDIPLDPHLFETISSSGVEVDLLQKRQIHYILKVVIALLPGLLIMCLLRESVMLLLVTSKRFLYKKYNQLFDMAYAENFILPVGDVSETKSMYKEVVLGGDVWDLLDELMIYMGNPMQYYERGVQFVRGVLLSGPPGTGKTLFARTLSKESGLPFVFASGAEFTDSEKSGAARINEMFSIARRNAPAFIFVDEIDAIAGRHARKDPRRRATFEALIDQLDGEKEKTGVDRFSLKLSRYSPSSPLMAASSLALGFSFWVLLISPALSLTCTSQKFTNNLYTHCLDLPTLNSFLHFTYDSSNRTLSVAFVAAAEKSDGWIAWALNPTGTGMAGAQALVAYKDSKGSMTVSTYNISSYESIVKSKKLSFDVWDTRADESGGMMRIFGKIEVPKELATAGKINQIWQVGPSVSGDGLLAKHQFVPANLNAKGSLDLGGATNSGVGTDSRIKKRNIHGILNAVSWGILFPIGVIVARYLRTFESADPVWFYLHIFCQVSAYAIGVAGWATGLQLGSQSKAITFTTHRNLGIALFSLATVQVLALLLRPRKDHKYRLYWNIYHHSVGYAILVLGILNVFKGLDILRPLSKWKSAYTITIIVLGGIAVLLEVITWIVVIVKKRRSAKSTKPLYNNGSSTQQSLAI